MSSFRSSARRQRNSDLGNGELPVPARPEAATSESKPVPKPEGLGASLPVDNRRFSFSRINQVPFKLLLAVLASALATAVILFFFSDRQVQSVVGGPNLVSFHPQQPLLPSLPRSSQLSLHHRVQRGDTLATIIQRYGISPEVTLALQESLNSGAKKHDFSPVIKIDQRLEFSFNTAGELQSMLMPIATGRHFEFGRQGDGSYRGGVKIRPVRPVERIAVGVIKSSFAAAASAAGIKYDLVDEFVDLFSGRISFHRDLRKGDRFTLIYQDQIIDNGTSIGAGAILAAALDAGGVRYVAVRYVGADSKPRYFNQKGELLGDSFLRYPLKFSRISSHFSTSRFHPVLKRRRPHNGVDFAAATGTPVRSVANGKVVIAGRNGGNGIMVKIQHDARYSTAYLHLSKLAGGIRRGSILKRGQVIGAVGMTGLATGPHLHYSFYDRGRYVDPLKIKLPMLEQLNSRTRISERYLKRVLFSLQHYQSVTLDNYYTDRI